MSEQASWKRLGLIEPDALVDARATLHWGVRVVSAADPLASSAGTEHGLQWLESLGCLAGPPLSAADGRSVGLRVEDLCLLVLNRDGEEEGQLALDNLSAENALLWLKFTLGLEEAPTLDKAGLPAHAIEQGEVFNALDASAFTELARWYGNAAGMLDELRARSGDSSEVRCSSSTLELSTAIELEGDGEKRIVVGMMPGGAEFPAPHWFVRATPRPGSAPGESLPGGAEWHQGEWLGAVLRAAAIVGAGDASAQRELVDAFLSAAVEQCEALLG